MDFIPPHLKESIDEYVRVGRPTGSFLRAVLSNDFLGAFEKADDHNTIIMQHYAKYIYNDIPMACHGSYEIYDAWVAKGGREGKKEVVDDND